MEKTNTARKVLQLMDKDYSYCAAVRKVLRANPRMKRGKLERSLNPFI